MKKLKARGLHEHVIEEIGRRIISGEFRADQALPGEALLCNMLGISRTALREGLRVLASKGLVDPKRKIGTQVRNSSHWNFLDADVLTWLLSGPNRDRAVQELYELRHLLEPIAASLAARNAKQSDIRVLRSAYAQMELAGDDGEKVAGPDLAFHQAIIAASGNRLFSALAPAMSAALAANFQFVTDLPHGHLGALPLHRRILEAIESGDPNAARVAMQALIEYSQEEARTVAERTTRTTSMAVTRRKAAKTR